MIHLRSRNGPASPEFGLRVVVRWRNLGPTVYGRHQWGYYELRDHDVRLGQYQCALAVVPPTRYRAGPGAPPP